MSLVLDDLPRDPEWLLQQLQQVAEVAATERSRNIALEIERDTATAERDAVRAERDAAQAEIEKLRLLIRQLRRGRFGRRSEKLDPDQLQLGLEDLEQTVAAAEAAREEAAARSGTPRSPRSRRRNLGALPAHLPRVEVLVDVEDKSCPCCGGAMHVIGEDASEMLDVVPAVLRVRVVRRPRYGCRACEGAVVQAPAPERPVTGGMATEALLAHVLVAKFCDHLPLYRQAVIFARQGIDLDRSTLCDWVGRACWWLEPLWHMLRRHVMGSTRIFADDTTLPVLDPGRGRTKTGRLWGYAIDDRPWGGSTPPAVVYLYAEDRRGEHPAAHLAEFHGVLQVDGYGGFKGLLENRPPGEVRLAFCWAHCRRRFYDIHQATGSPLAEEALRRIGELYKIEAEIRGRPSGERQAVRQERSKPLVEGLHAWLTAQLGRVSGKSGLAEAIRYALRHWQGLVLFLDDGRLELGRVEDGRGGVSLPVGYGGAFAPPPQSGLAWLRFPSPLVEPDVRISRIRLSPVISDLRIRRVDTPAGQLVEAEHLVEVRVGVSAVPRASPAAPAHQPASDAPFGVELDRAVDTHDRPLVEVPGPATDHRVQPPDPVRRLVRVPLRRRRVVDRPDQPLHGLTRRARADERRPALAVEATDLVAEEDEAGLRQGGQPCLRLVHRQPEPRHQLPHRRERRLPVAGSAADHEVVGVIDDVGIEPSAVAVPLPREEEPAEVEVAEQGRASRALRRPPVSVPRLGGAPGAARGTLDHRHLQPALDHGQHRAVRDPSRHAAQQRTVRDAPEEGRRSVPLS